ncbi:MAG: 2-dehydro-3-deoxygalactonokinase [Parasphingorhabdus sp.]|jgi:2-dehydro-3-deoxygalactonokinase
MIAAGIDWGSSSFRAYRFDSSGSHIDSVEGDCGIKFVEAQNFEKLLLDKVDTWLDPGDTVLLSGMITSRNGWIESPYISCPANLQDLIHGGLTRQIRDINLVFLPGLCQNQPPDVMRGEELQLLGADSDGLSVIPGTHSKWAEIKNGTVKQFCTIPTGELFEVLCNHTLIGALIEKNIFNPSAFTEGVDRGYRNNTIISELFSTRSAVLLQQRNEVEAYWWLSGLLIGNEIREGRSLVANFTGSILLIGSESLCEKYQVALEHLGIDTRTASPDVTMRGFQKIIGVH